MPGAWKPELSHINFSASILRAESTVAHGCCRQSDTLHRYSISLGGAPGLGGSTLGTIPAPGCHRKFSDVAPQSDTTALDKRMAVDSTVAMLVL